jgi:hypothetical protein
VNWYKLVDRNAADITNAGPMKMAYSILVIFAMPEQPWVEISRYATK